MHIVFVHQNFPAQFGHVARWLAREHDCRCTFVTHCEATSSDGIEVVRYIPRGGATQRTHYCARTFENAIAHAHGVYEACRASRLKPDLVVGHSGFGSTLFLRELFDCPIINYFEYFYQAHNSDMDFRPEFRAQEIDVLRAYARNAMLLLDLENCDAGYSPTFWQRSRFPKRYQDKIEVIFDGIDTRIWKPHPKAQKRAGDTRLVTYVSRGFESMRGFDIFMRVARRIYEQVSNVVFAVVGTDRVAYGGDLKYIKARSFREYVLAQDNYDLSKFVFTGRLPPSALAGLLAASDLHIYLTVPFVLSWSLFNALACGATVLASDTEPVREVVQHGETGLLADFFDVDRLSRIALEVLGDPPAYRSLGEAGLALIEERYSLKKTLPRMQEFYQRTVGLRANADYAV